VFSRVFVIVLDSVGVGELPDAAAYGDGGSDTVGNIAKAVALRLPTLRSLGLSRVARMSEQDLRVPRGAFGRMAEASPGKDSVTGHWEMMGVVLGCPFPVFPNGFPPEVISEFERRIGRGTIGNLVASGTVAIADLGSEHLRTGKPIVYTSADSVFQIAAHEKVIPVAEQYRMCEIAFELVGRGMGVGRVIARPFVGAPGAFTRTANRHDYVIEPFGETLLDRLAAAGVPVLGIGKVTELFAGRGIGRSLAQVEDRGGMNHLDEAVAELDRGLAFANLVDFDTLYGHRNDTLGYAANLEQFDTWLASALERLRRDDLLVITADHGNDPTMPGTDHSREYVPVFAVGPRVPAGVDLGTRSTFADLGQTLAENFNVPELANGQSFLRQIRA
jgi:phosphopentomutase